MSGAAIWVAIWLAITFLIELARQLNTVDPRLSSLARVVITIIEYGAVVWLLREGGFW